MARFKKSKSEGTPGLNTGSMSDIVFMFLFFFMVITNMRESTLYVKIKVPQASEVQKLEKKSSVSYINVGVPMDERKYGHEPRIQLNDQISEVSDIAEFIENERAARNEVDRPFLTTSIKADKDARMGIIVDIKQELRNVNALKLIYTTSRRGKE